MMVKKQYPALMKATTLKVKIYITTFQETNFASIFFFNGNIIANESNWNQKE
jgi:hypothetical protein